MGIDFIFGSMRINSLQKDDAIYLLRYMLSRGLRSFHVSYEYETYDYFRSCLFKALELQKINPNDTITDNINEKDSNKSESLSNTKD